MSGKTKYIWNGNTFVDVTGWRPPPRRTPYIIRDQMDALQHPATGEVMDSKSRFREVTRANGMVELGNDCPNSPNVAPLSARERKQDIATAIEMLEQGHQAPPLESISDWGGETTRMYGDA